MSGVQTGLALEAKEKLIVALDTDSADKAWRTFEELRDCAGMFKVGSQLFTSAGPEFVRKLVARGSRVFLDLKFHDIPNTVAAASREAVRLGVAIFNMHGCGGSEMMKRAAEATAEESARLGVQRPRAIAVTVLTSADKEVLSETGVAASDVETQVKRLAVLARSCGLDGVVASPHEIGPVRNAVVGKDFIIVTPGVRPAGTPRNDQKRVMTPVEAIQAGADYIVVGRAILDAPDRSRAAREIIEEIESSSSTY